MAYDSARPLKKVPNTAFEASMQSEYFTNEPDYTENESQYREFLLRTLETDRNRRESPHKEFNGMTYTQNYQANYNGANSYTPPRQNKEDTQVVTGTTREKVLAIVSAVLNLNFETTFRAFDRDDMEDEGLAEAMSDCVERSNKIELWDDKKLYVYYEMAVQGDVYVEEIFVDETITDKKKIKLSEVTDALMKDFKADYKTKVTFSGCQRNIIPGTQVYKGSMTERELSKQPHIFTREVRPYEVAKSIYGNLPRWQHVPRRLVNVGPDNQTDTPYGINWRLEETENETVEIIKYQDKWNDEYQIIINGVMMLPVGFPMPWEYAEYNLVQGSLEPISPFFSESKSVPTKTKLDQEILDEMYRLAVLKTQKSFMPPIANYTTNILTRSNFLPGKINNNMQRGDVEVLGGDPGQYSIKPSEFEMIKMIREFIDQKSISPVLQGIQPSGETTATEINTVTQQAKQQLGLLIYGFIRLHQNLDMLRLYNILENYTKPTDTKLNKTKEGLINKYRSLTVSKEIAGKGLGTKSIEFTDEPSDPRDLYDMENGITRSETGQPLSVTPPKKPMRIMQVSPKALREIKYNWYAVTEPVERETSMAARIAYEDRILKAMQLFGQQSVNTDYASLQWAIKNKIDPEKFFNSAPTQMPMVPEMGAAQESNMQKQMRPFSSGAGPAEASRQGMEA